MLHFFITLVAIGRASQPFPTPKSVGRRDRNAARATVESTLLEGIKTYFERSAPVWEYWHNRNHVYHGIMHRIVQGMVPPR
jgi:hypothetical protein